MTVHHPLPEVRDLTAFKRARQAAARHLIEKVMREHVAIIEAVATGVVVATAVTGGQVTDEVEAIARATYEAGGGDADAVAKASVMELLEAVLAEMRGPA